MPEVADPGDLLLRLLAAPNICAKTWVYEQYDQVVGSGTVTRPGSDAGVVRLTPSDRAIAVALDGDGARVALDPRRGAAEAVAQAALNVACSGAEPAAITNCLNFGNPERPGTAYALREAITGMAEACEVLGTPVVSGNVSLYNESGGRPIHPTPVVGCVGVLERADSAVPLAPAGKSGALFLLGGPEPVYDGSEWQALVAGEAAGRIPEVDLPALRWLTDLLFGLAREGGGLVRSAHDASDGGLAVALAEIALAADAGLEVTLEPRTGAAEMLFGECCGLVVVSCAPEDEAKLSEACDAAGVPVEKSAPWAARRSHCAAASSRSTWRWRTRARPTRARSPTRWRPCRCAACSASTRPGVTSRGSPTSRSTRCSTAARRAPASPSPTGAACSRCVTWGSSRRSSTRASCRRCRAARQSGMRATRRPGRRTG